ncbi:MAG: hypothetical protein ABJO01_02275 [Parasphingorhabdus sp.]|uniref:hypothetical protein n=1 Tax=Parasphingorhabdus sp. TaxID=2709688 RepID=UPI0032984A1C
MEKAQRPKSILWFEICFLASILSSTIDLIMHWESFWFDTEFDDASRQFFVIVTMLTLVASYAIQICLWYFIAHRASNFARWGLVALTILGSLSIAINFKAFAGSELIFLIVTQSLVLASILFLFLGNSSEWFRTKGAITTGATTQLSDIFR